MAQSKSTTLKSTMPKSTTMEYRQLGESDLQVSVIGLGGNTYGPPRIDQEMTTKNILRARELGINFIDTAIGYGQGQSETLVGTAVKDCRDDFVIATKFTLRNREGQSVRDRIFAHCEESLTKLQMDHIDLYQLHFPDPAVSQEEIIGPLNELIQQGKVRYLGESNYAGWRHAQSDAAAAKIGGARMITAQNHYNILRREVELDLLPYCAATKTSFIPYFPLGGGFLTGKYTRGEDGPPGSRGAAGSPIIKRTRSDRNEDLLPLLTKFAEDHGHTILELAFGWLLSHPQIDSVISGNSNPEQVESNAAASTWRLTEEEMTEVNEIAAWDGSTERIETAGGG